MGYGMAVNLRKKMKSSMTLLICDVNEGALKNFQTEMNEGPIQVVKNGAARGAVCLCNNEVATATDRGFRM